MHRAQRCRQRVPGIAEDASIERLRGRRPIMGARPGMDGTPRKQFLVVFEFQVGGCGPCAGGRTPPRDATLDDRLAGH
jgi:hypothetical protein